MKLLVSRSVLPLRHRYAASNSDESGYTSMHPAQGIEAATWGDAVLGSLALTVAKSRPEDELNRFIEIHARDHYNRACHTPRGLH